MSGAMVKFYSNPTGSTGSPSNLTGFSLDYMSLTARGYHLDTGKLDGPSWKKIKQIIKIYIDAEKSLKNYISSYPRENLLHSKIHFKKIEFYLEEVGTYIICLYKYIFVSLFRVVSWRYKLVYKLSLLHCDQAILFSHLIGIDELK